MHCYYFNKVISQALYFACLGICLHVFTFLFTFSHFTKRFLRFERPWPCKVWKLLLSYKPMRKSQIFFLLLQLGPHSQIDKYSSLPRLSQFFPPLKNWVMDSAMFSATTDFVCVCSASCQFCFFPFLFKDLSVLFISVPGICFSANTHTHAHTHTHMESVTWIYISYLIEAVDLLRQNQYKDIQKYRDNWRSMFWTESSLRLYRKWFVILFLHFQLMGQAANCINYVKQPFTHIQKNMLTINRLCYVLQLSMCSKNQNNQHI